jgi:peptidoglycan hydrolase-like protein with peptidoglycan-binding domain
MISMTRMVAVHADQSSSMLTVAMKNVRLGLLLGVFTLVVAACGGSAAETTTTTAQVVVTPPPTTTVATTTIPTTTTTTTIAGLGATSTMIVVQQDLSVLGYFTGTIDGIAGAETQSAIAKFQADAGIEADGEFGPATDAAMVEALQADDTYVKLVQTNLTDLDFYTGPIDGDYGKGTQTAVKKLQASCDLEETGQLDITTRLCLAELL